MGAIETQRHNAVDNANATAIVPRMARTPRSTLIDPEQAAQQALEREEQATQREFGDLASLASADAGWKWHVHRMKSRDEMEKNPRGKPRVWVTTLHGGVELDDFNKRYGGGVYEFWGFLEGELQTRVSVELDGEPRRPVVADPAPAAAPLNGHADVRSRTERILLRTIRRQDERFEKLLATIAAANTSQPRDPMSEVVKAMVAMHTMVRSTSPPPAASDTELLKTSMDMLRQGIEIGQTREPTTTPDGTDWVKVAEIVTNALPNVLGVIAKRQAARAAAAARPPGATVAEPSIAEVVTDPPAPAAAVQPGVSHRWMTATESLADAIAHGDDPKDFADVLVERILNTQEVGLLRLATVDHVIARLEPAFESLPVLNTPQARDYIAAVLEEVKNPTPDSE